MTKGKEDLAQLHDMNEGHRWPSCTHGQGQGHVKRNNRHTPRVQETCETTEDFKRPTEGVEKSEEGFDSGRDGKQSGISYT